MLKFDTNYKDIDGSRASFCAFSLIRLDDPYFELEVHANGRRSSRGVSGKRSTAQFSRVSVASVPHDHLRNISSPLR